jgi:hypothetical protein
MKKHECQHQEFENPYPSGVARGAVPLPASPTFIPATWYK